MTYLAADYFVCQKLTLKQYQQQLLEKRKALEALKPEERKVDGDTDFESMQLVGRKKEDSLLIKQVGLVASLLSSIGRQCLVTGYIFNIACVLFYSRTLRRTSLRRRMTKFAR